MQQQISESANKLLKTLQQEKKFQTEQNLDMDLDLDLAATATAAAAAWHPYLTNAKKQKFFLPSATATMFVLIAAQQIAFDFTNQKFLVRRT